MAISAMRASIGEDADACRLRCRSELLLRAGIVIRTDRSLCNDMQSEDDPSHRSVLRRTIGAE
jgi:hypothetical protein